ncbi:MAG: SPOR domain-containing protein [Magnetococcus sp. YQC-5]
MAKPPQPSFENKTAENATEEPTEESTPSGDKTASSTNANKKGYTVQIASFNDDERASALVDKLSSLMYDGKRMPVYKFIQKTGNKAVYRVTLGPFANHLRAQRAANLAHNKTKVNGVIVGPEK